MCLAFSADGRRIASGSGSADRSIKVWDAETGREIKTIGGSDGKVNLGVPWSVAFSPDGTAIAAALATGTFPLLDIATGTLKVRAGEGDNSVYYSMFSPDGKRLIAGQGNQVKIRDASNGRWIKDIDGFSGGVYAPPSTPRMARG